MAKAPSRKNDEIEQAKRIMSALVKQPPKPHEDMKVGKSAPGERKGRSGRLRQQQSDKSGKTAKN